MNTIKLLGIVGSLRGASYNHALMEGFQKLAPAHIAITVARIDDLPLYNEDLEAEFPKSAAALKDAIRAADGIMIATPEYNRSIPGVLKNAIDWTSRPYGDNAWATKPVLVLGASPGAVGTAVAQSHLKQILLYLDTRVLGQPEFYLGGARDKFDAHGVLTDEKTKEHIRKALDTLTRYIEENRR